MKTIKIEIPDGYEVESFNKETGEIQIRPQKPTSIMERVKSIQDAIDVLGNNDPDVVDYKSLVVREPYQQRPLFHPSPHLVKYQEAILITKALNEGWVPDWSNSDEDKYYPWFDMRGSSGFRFDDGGAWHAYSVVGSRLCFKSRELCEYAGKHFTEVYKQFMIIQ